MFVKRLWLFVLLLMSATLVFAQDGFEEIGEITDDTPEVSYELNLDEGATVTITVEAASDDLDPIVTLLNPDGDVVAQNDDIDTEGQNYNSQVTYQATESGTHTIVVSAYRGTGEFILTVEMGGEAPVPDDEESGRPDLDQTFETENFLIHYTEDGDNAADEDFVEAAGEIAEQVWDIEINEMGWPAPPSDEGTGGDDRFDLYLMELCTDEGNYGYAAPEGPQGDNPNTDAVEQYAVSSYLVVDNNFDDTCFDGGTGDLLTTVAHELHHNIQFGFDIKDAHDWYYEATATWMETQIAGDAQQATIYVPELFLVPEVCFGSPDASLRYGTYLFIQSLVDAHGEGIVLELWENIAQVEGFPALEMTLEAHHDDIPSAVARFHLQNLVRAYPLADQFDATVWLETMIDDTGSWTTSGSGIQELSANFFFANLDTGNYYAEITGDEADGLILFAISIYDGQADIYALDSGGVFTTDYDYTYLMVFNTNYDDTPDDCTYLTDYEIEISEADDDPDDVFMTLDAENFQPLGQ